MRSRSAFTLIELVVVVMIIGIIAAIVTPKVVKMTQTATDNSARQTLTVLRGAIDAYASSNNGAFPTLTGSGSTSFVTTYLRSAAFPACPVGAAAGNNGVTVQTTGAELSGNADASPTNGWKFDSSSGEIIINSNATDHGGVQYSTY